MEDINKKTVLVIDNYDSFTYNLVHLINEVGYEAEVWRNDKFELADVAQYDKILLSIKIILSYLSSAYFLHP
jgi:anthranilate synthase component 2